MFAENLPTNKYGLRYFRNMEYKGLRLAGMMEGNHFLNVSLSKKDYKYTKQ